MNPYFYTKQKIDSLLSSIRGLLPSWLTSTMARPVASVNEKTPDETTGSVVISGADIKTSNLYGAKTIKEDVTSLKEDVNLRRLYGDLTLYTWKFEDESRFGKGFFSRPKNRSGATSSTDRYEYDGYVLIIDNMGISGPRLINSVLEVSLSSDASSTSTRLSFGNGEYIINKVSVSLLSSSDVTDQLVSASEGKAADAEAVGEALSQCLAKTGGTLTGGIAIDGPNSETDSIKLGRASSSPGIYTINPYGINRGGETSNPTYPFYGTNRIARLDDTVEAAKSLTAAGQTALFASSVSCEAIGGTAKTSAANIPSGGVVDITQASGAVNVTFADAVGNALRYCELIVRGVTSDGGVTINLPSGMDALYAEGVASKAGINHYIFAEYSRGHWLVSRSTRTATI